MLKSQPGRSIIIESVDFNRFEINLEIKSKMCRLMVDDLKGKASFHAIRDTFIYPNTHVILVAYSVTCEDSFNNVYNYVRIYMK